MNNTTQRSSKYKNYFFLFLASLLVATLSHFFFIVEWFDGRMMTGPNDGLSQMLPFKQLLYEQYSQGNFFYADQFGMGGGTYSQLSYYFSTSILFIASVIITLLLEVTGLIGEPDLFYWANTLIPISIIRVTLIIIATTLYFNYMKINKLPAFVGAVLYGTSVIYFRHVTFWEFFADAMLWLPILLYGVEKIIREGKSSWFIFAIALCLVNNFYFAYINILLATIYIVFRWFFSLQDGETKIIIQIKKYILGGIIGFGISAVSFIPAVYGYLNNHRIAYNGHIPLYELGDNPLLNGKVIVVPAIVILCLFVIPFYKTKTFSFFASVTIFSYIIHFSPFVASVFNGFSAPQYRWEYFLALVAAGVVAVGLQHLQSMKRIHIVIAVIGMTMVYSWSYFSDPLLVFPNWQAAYLVYAAVATGLVFMGLLLKNNKQMMPVLAIFLIMMSLYTSNFFQSVKLSEAGHVQNSTLEWMHSDAYIGNDQMELLQKIQDTEIDDFYRIDWMTPTRNNTPIVQQFNGFSVYSSILNNHLLYFYLNDLEIDMGRESVSRYGTVGNRANLASLLAGKYYIAERNNKNIPYGFKEKYVVGNYVAYENTNLLPFVKTAKTVYTEEALVDFPPLVRERAMIDGIILKEDDKKSASPVAAYDWMPDVAIKETGAMYQDGQLTVTEKSGGIDLILPPSTMSEAEDYYVSFELKRLDRSKQFKLKVNEYQTIRKKNSSIYKTGVDQLTIRVSAAPEISIRLPKGTYALSDLKLYAEDYASLKTAKALSEQQPDIPYTWSKNKVSLTYDNDTAERFITLPIPFEKGWKASINGQRQDVLQANYAFLGLALQDGENDIKLVYYPPYFGIALTISLLSLMLVAFIALRKTSFRLFKARFQKNS